MYKVNHGFIPGFFTCVSMQAEVVPSETTCSAMIKWSSGGSTSKSESHISQSSLKISDSSVPCFVASPSSSLWVMLSSISALSLRSTRFYSVTSNRELSSHQRGERIRFYQEQRKGAIERFRFLNQRSACVQDVGVKMVHMKLHRPLSLALLSVTLICLSLTKEVNDEEDSSLYI